MFFTLQFLYILSSRSGGMWHVAATMLALWGGLFILQAGAFPTASVVIPVIGALLLAVPSRKEYLWGDWVLTSLR